MSSPFNQPEGLLERLGLQAVTRSCVYTASILLSYHGIDFFEKVTLFFEFLADCSYIVLE